MTLRRGKGDGAAPWPVRATGPGACAEQSQLPEAQWGDSPPGPHPSVVFRSYPAIRATPAPLSRRTLTGHLPPNTPSSIAAGCPLVQPDGMTFPGHHRVGLPGDAGVSQALAAGGPRPGDRTGPHPHPDRRQHAPLPVPAVPPRRGATATL